MRSPFRRAIPRVAAIVVLSAAAAGAQPLERPPSERADPFVGTWILNVAKSTYEGAPPPKSGMRTFDYERDNMILCTSYQTTASGRPSWVHYLITLDGRKHEEMSRSTATDPGRTPTMVAAKKLDDRAIDLEFSRNGKTHIWHSWTISPDGKTFTIKRKGTTAQGKPTYFVMVYDKES